MSEITDLHEPFATFLRREKIPFIRARSDRESTIALGHPDFTLLFCNRALMIEFKYEKGALSKDQKERIAYLESAGCSVHVVRDINAAVELALAWKEMMPVMPVAVLANTKDSGKLARLNGWIWKNESGGWGKLRKETPQDASIPSMI